MNLCRYTNYVTVGGNVRAVLNSVLAGQMELQAVNLHNDDVTHNVSSSRSSVKSVSFLKRYSRYLYVLFGTFEGCIHLQVYTYRRPPDGVVVYEDVFLVLFVQDLFLEYKLLFVSI